MLAKIHLKTACGCTREFFEKDDWIRPVYRVPIGATVVLPRVGPLPSEVWDIRNFLLIDKVWKSSRRVELWYEEIVEC